MAFSNLSQFVNPGNPLPQIDITSGYRQWQAQRLNEAQLAEQKRQAEVNAAHQSRVSDDINSRFAIEQGQQTADKQYESESNRFKQQQILLSKARASAAEGRWNEVESMMGTLKSLGANVDRTLDTNGRPSYRLEEGSAPSISGPSFDSVQQQIQRGHGYQAPAGRLEVNRFDTPLGTAAESTRPQVEVNPSQDPQQATQQPQEQQQSSSSFDPYALKYEELNKMNAMRLDPMLEHLKRAFPDRYQSNAEELFTGIRAMGASPEGTLEALQKPLDTASRTWNAEMSSEGQMARAGISQSGRQDSQDRLLVNDGEKAAEGIAKEYGVQAAVSNIIEMQQIEQQLMANNANSNGDGVKALLSMREGNRLTDKDFNIGVTGIASNLEQLKTAMQRVYTNGLTESQKSNFRELIKMFQDGNKRRIAGGAKKMMHYIKRLRSEPERYGAYRKFTGVIPEEYWPEEVRNQDAAENSFGGRSAPRSSSTRKSVNVTAPTTQQAVDGAEELDEFQ